jgi:hypothetical protein
MSEVQKIPKLCHRKQCDRDVVSAPDELNLWRRLPSKWHPGLVSTAVPPTRPTIVMSAAAAAHMAGTAATYLESQSTVMQVIGLICRSPFPSHGQNCSVSNI